MCAPVDALGSLSGGLTAIDNEWCNTFPESCGVVQRVLERSPGLVWANGEFRHGYDVFTPDPPPPPNPPPGLDYGDGPPPPPMPPPPPPPFWAGAEDCVPLPPPEFAGPRVARERVDAAPHEERSACLVAKRILDVRRKASACFSAVAAPNPPPPPFSEVSSRSEALDLYRQRLQRGEGGAYSLPVSSDKETHQEHAAAAIARVEELVRELGGGQPTLRGLLDGAVEELQQVMGRRLMMRQDDYVTSLKDALSTSAVQRAVGIHGIPGLTGLSCESLCEAVSRDANASNTDSCSAYAFRRDHPDSKTDLTGHCWLLTSAGACKPVDFATALWTRHVESESVCEESRPGKDNTLCVGLPATRRDTLVLSHGDAAAIAAQLPDASSPSPGAGGLPAPRSTLEAMCAGSAQAPSSGALLTLPAPPQAFRRLRSAAGSARLQTTPTHAALTHASSCRASRVSGRRPQTLRWGLRSRPTGSLQEART